MLCIRLCKKWYKHDWTKKKVTPHEKKKGTKIREEGESDNEGEKMCNRA